MEDILTTDIIDNEVDIQFQNGDFLLGDDLQQAVALILKYGTGHLRQYPDLGVHIDEFNNGVWSQAIKNKINIELAKDNIKIKDISKINNIIHISL